MKTKPCETNESADAPKRELVFLEARRFKKKKKKKPWQKSDVRVREDRQGPGSSGAVWTVRGKGPDMEGEEGEWGEWGGDLFQWREKGHSVS